MIDPTLKIDLTEWAVELGGTFRGRVVRAGELDDLATESNQRARAVRLELRWFTEGRGDTDEATVATTTLPLDHYGRVEAIFDLPVPPDNPISYDGTLIRVRWELIAQVDIKMQRDPITIIPVLVMPHGGHGYYTRPHPLR